MDIAFTGSCARTASPDSGVWWSLYSPEARYKWFLLLSNVRSKVSQTKIELLVWVIYRRSSFWRETETTDIECALEEAPTATENTTASDSKSPSVSTVQGEVHTETADPDIGVALRPDDRLLQLRHDRLAIGDRKANLASGHLAEILRDHQLGSMRFSELVRPFKHNCR